MGTITEDIHVGADWIAKALSSSGYAADFSPPSLWEIDRFFDDHSRNGEAVPGGLLGNDLGCRLFSIGAYVGEVIRRSVGGEWRGDDSDPQAEINIELVVAGSTCWPVQRVMKRFKNGAEDGVAAYGTGLGLDVGHEPERPEEPEGHSRPWWKFW